MMLQASSCERPSKSSASVLLPSSVSNSYSFSTGTQGSSRRFLRIPWFRSACSASSFASSARAASHSSRVPILCSRISSSFELSHRNLPPTSIFVSRGTLASRGGLRVAQRPGRGQVLASLQQRLQPGEDHRPAAVELAVGALVELIVDHGQPAGVLADRLDLPGHPRGALALHLVAPQRGEGLDEAPRRIDLDILTLGDVDDAGNGRLVTRALGPVGFGTNAEAVLRAHLPIRDRLPEALRTRLDVDLEYGRGVIRMQRDPGLGKLLHGLPP